LTLYALYGARAQSVYIGIPLRQVQPDAQLNLVGERLSMIAPGGAATQW